MLSANQSGGKLSLSNQKINIGNFGMYIVIAGLFIFFAITSPYFLKAANFINILISVSVVGIVATTQTLAIIGRGVDLTVGSIAAMTACVQAFLVLINEFPWYIGMLASIGVGLLIGWVNGIIIVKFNLNPFIVTLGMMNVVRGLAYVMVDGMSYYVTEPGLVFLGRVRIGGLIPISIIILIISFLVFEYISKKTIFGRNVYAAGGNIKAARLAGIDTSKNAIIIFTLGGFMAALAGIVIVGISGSAMPSAAETIALDSITAVLLGGTSLMGGQGSIGRTFLGVAVIGIINNGMALLNVQTFWQTVAKGCLLLGAIILDAKRKH